MGTDRAAVRDSIVAWFGEHARDLPWRRSDASPWGIVVSEFMLQQTPVSRVLGPWRAWLTRWPTPSALAAEPAGEAVTAWGRLGYPRRALRLHATATAIVARHNGEVPADIGDLLALPGVGGYTAAAVASFAYGRRHVVLDTNVRRVLCRIEGGVALPGPAVTAAERARAEEWLPDVPSDAAEWAAASMELGALACTATAPRCGECPVAAHRAWLAAGRPDNQPAQRRQAWRGTDRQCRGMVVQALRERSPLTLGELQRACTRQGWEVPERVAPLLADLVAEGLVHAVPGGYSLLPVIP